MHINFRTVNMFVPNVKNEAKTNKITNVVCTKTQIDNIPINNKFIKYNNIISFGSSLKFTFNKSILSSYIEQIKHFQRPNAQIHALFGIEKYKVNFPGINKTTEIFKDIYPVALPHLVIIRPNNQILSLAEISENQGFRLDLKK